MPEPLSPERLTEIQNLASLIAWESDAALPRKLAGEDVPDLLDEIDRLKAENARLEAQVALLGSHLQRDALDVVDRLRAQAAEQEGQ